MPSIEAGFYPQTRTRVKRSRRFDASCYTPGEVAGLYSGGRRALLVIQAYHRGSPPRIRHWPDPLNGDAGANVNSGYTDLNALRQ
jgi:hypothetical protein